MVVVIADSARLAGVSRAEDGDAHVRAVRGADHVCGDGGEPVVAVVFISLAAAAHQGWSANLMTFPSDMFPRRTVASVAGIGGFGGAVGGMCIATFTGYLLEWTHSYVPVFMLAGTAYLGCAAADTDGVAAAGCVGDRGVGGMASGFGDERMALKIKAKDKSRWDAVSLGEVMLRFDPGDKRIWTTLIVRCVRRRRRIQRGARIKAMLRQRFGGGDGVRG